ncbi:unnamed protein product, partial [Bubo scandiacus]
WGGGGGTDTTRHRGAVGCWGYRIHSRVWGAVGTGPTGCCGVQRGAVGCWGHRTHRVLWGAVGCWGAQDPQDNVGCSGVQGSPGGSQALGGSYEAPRGQEGCV